MTVVALTVAGANDLTESNPGGARQSLSGEGQDLPVVALDGAERGEVGCGHDDSLKVA